MDGFRVGDRCVPLKNSGRYGPKEWKLQPLRPQDIVDGIKRLWVEVPMSEGRQDVARLNSTLWWASHGTWERSIPVTQADLDKYNLPQEYLDGFAAFPSPLPYPPGQGAEPTGTRLKSEDLWMEHYRAMEALQTTILPPTKPADTSTTGRYFAELKRGD